MKSTITLDLKANTESLTKALRQFNRSSGNNLSNALNNAINSSVANIKELEKQLKSANKPSAYLQEHLSALKAQVKEATSAKLELDLSAANQKIDGMRYQLLGIYASFKGLFQKPISIAMDFETSMADVKKVVDFDSVKELKLHSLSLKF